MLKELGLHRILVRPIILIVAVREHKPHPSLRNFSVSLAACLLLLSLGDGCILPGRSAKRPTSKLQLGRKWIYCPVKVLSFQMLSNNEISGKIKHFWKLTIPISNLTSFCLFEMFHCIFYLLSFWVKSLFQKQHIPNKHALAAISSWMIPTKNALGVSQSIAVSSW